MNLKFSKSEVVDSLNLAFRKFSGDDHLFSTQIFFQFEDYLEERISKLSKEDLSDKTKNLIKFIESKKNESESHKLVLDEKLSNIKTEFNQINLGNLFFNEENEILKYKSWYWQSLKDDIEYRRNKSFQENYQQELIKEIDFEFSSLENKLKESSIDDKNKIKSKLEKLYFQKQSLEKSQNYEMEKTLELIERNNSSIKNREDELSKFLDMNTEISINKLDTREMYSNYRDIEAENLFHEIKKDLEEKEKSLKEKKIKDLDRRDRLENSTKARQSRLNRALFNLSKKIRGYEDEILTLKNANELEYSRIYGKYYNNNENSYSSYKLTEEEKNFWAEEINGRRKIIEDRKIENIYHFSPYENLSGILREGILSREELNNRKRKSAFTDDERWDRREDFICTSLSFPNSKLLRKKEYEHRKDFLIFSISPEILFMNVCIFCPTNAAKNHPNFKPSGGHSFKNLSVNEDFLRLFDKTEIRNMNNIKNNEPTDIQAEVLIFKKIPIHFIKNIYCKDTVILTKILSEFPDVNKRNANFVQVNSLLFEQRHDQQFWESKNFYDFD